MISKHAYVCFSFGMPRHLLRLKVMCNVAHYHERADSYFKNSQRDRPMPDCGPPRVFRAFGRITLGSSKCANA